MKMTLLELLNKSVLKYGNRPALSWVDEQPLTYSEINYRIDNLKALLHKNGISKGDRVALLGENSPNWGISYLAITTMGAVVVPILTEFHQNEIMHILRHSGAKGIIVSEKLFSKIEDEITDIMNIVIKMDTFSLVQPETSKDKILKFIDEGKSEIKRLRQSAMNFVGISSDELQEDDLASIVYTSGTTGHSKGVMLSHKNIVFDTQATLKIQNIVPTDKLISVLPLAHTYECTIGFILPFSKGAATYYMKKPPTARVLLPAMQKIRPTMILTVPLIMEKIFKTKVHPTLNKNFVSRALYKIPFIRMFLHFLAGRKLMASFGNKLHFFGIGGALLSPDVEKFLREAKIPYSIGYGLTETSPLIAGCTPKITRFRATGVVIPGVEVKINKKKPTDSEGEILVKGPIVMKGYFKDPEKTAEVFDEFGYFKTGDLGVLKNDYLYIKGRIKNVILGSSGENIYPEEIESTINENDNVLESLVYQAGDKIIARVFLNYENLDKENKSETRMRKRVQQILDEIRSDVNKQVSSFSKIHKIIEQTEPFEKTPTKKIKRYLYT